MKRSHAYCLSLFLTLLLPTMAFAQAETTAFGDLNCDGSVDVIDVTLSIIVALGLDLSVQLDGDGDNIPDACPAAITQVEVDVAYAEGVASVDITADNQGAYDAGYGAGAASVDITTDNQGAYDAGYGAGAASVDITSDNEAAIVGAMPACNWLTQSWDGIGCAPAGGDWIPNCFYMGMCGQEGLGTDWLWKNGQLAVSGLYSEYIKADAEAYGETCAQHYNDGTLAYSQALNTWAFQPCYYTGYGDIDMCPDIKSDNDLAIAAAMPSCDWSTQEWDGVSCIPAGENAWTPNCFYMGICGQDGLGSDWLGINGQLAVSGLYSEYTQVQAEAYGETCAQHYFDGTLVYSQGNGWAFQPCYYTE